MTVRRVATYGDHDGLLAELIELIDSASKRVWMKVPWWDTSPEAVRLLEATVRAQKRGADILILIRPEATNDAAIRYLQQANVRVEPIRFIHEKELVADDVFVAHSMNFTRQEIGRNENSGHVHDDEPVVDAAVASFTSLIVNSAAVMVGDGQWTDVRQLVPANWLRYMNQKQLNPLQSKAVPTVLTTTGHVMVVAPTSAGKTLIGEVAALRSILGEKRPAVWLLPARALAAEVAETTRRWAKHGIKAEELTGESNMSSARVAQAQLWVATTEKFESLYRRSTLKDFIAKIGCLVIDEVHLVGDPTRGATLESLIARLRQAQARTRIVALSATVANAEELAGWFNAQLIESSWRPTVLTTQLLPYESSENWKQREAAKDHLLIPLVRDLQEQVNERGEAGTVIVFCGSKRNVRSVAAQLAGVSAEADLDKLVEACFDAGVGLHFRDAPRAQRAVEAFRQRQINVIVATSTLATGVNLPALAVVIQTSRPE